MNKRLYFFLIILILLGTIGYLVFVGTSEKKLRIIYPINNSLFPPEFTAPTFKWIDKDTSTYAWLIKINSKNKKFYKEILSYRKDWRPSRGLWDSLKAASEFKDIVFRVLRFDDINKKVKSGSHTIILSISKDSVGAPILYRELILPFKMAEEHLDSLNFRLCDIGSYTSPHYAMKGMAVCGNCHSLTQDGQTIALDLDAGNRDKGGYFISKVQDTIVFDSSNFLSWTQLQNKRAYGMFSKISPDGRYIVTTMRDRIVIKNFSGETARTQDEFLNEIEFSQLFFPVNGVLGIYDRKTGILKELPGANDTAFVQTNAIWTPDGKNIIFAKAKALPYDSDSTETFVHNSSIINDFVTRKRLFKYDLHIIPFNEGKGGEAIPIKGASNNGKSNYFPAISNDGKWLIFCEAESFMLLMPDSKLKILGMPGGKSRFLECNFKSMNSWHAWSPNGKWIVYSSKAYGIFTQLFLSHINEDGHASIPILIENATKPQMAANYPEFVNRNASRPFNMDYRFIELTHVKTALYDEKDTLKAKEYLRQYLAQKKTKMAYEYLDLAKIEFVLKRYPEGLDFLNTVLKIDKNNEEAIELLSYYNKLKK